MWGCQASLGSVSAVELSLYTTEQVFSGPMNGGTHEYMNIQAEYSQGAPALSLPCRVTLYKFLHFSELRSP